MWLKTLRLHKYSYLFRQMTYEEMLNISEEWLEAQVSHVMLILKLHDPRSSLISINLRTTSRPFKMPCSPSLLSNFRFSYCYNTNMYIYILYIKNNKQTNVFVLSALGIVTNKQHCDYSAAMHYVCASMAPARRTSLIKRWTGDF